MRIAIKKQKLDSGLVSLKLDGEMNIYSVGKLKTALTKELNNSSGIRLDLSNVNQVDTSGFQLLVFMKRESEISGKTLTVAGMSNEVKAICGLYHEKL